MVIDITLKLKKKKKYYLVGVEIDISTWGKFQGHFTSFTIGQNGGPLHQSPVILPIGVYDTTSITLRTTCSNSTFLIDMGFHCRVDLLCMALWLERFLSPCGMSTYLLHQLK